MKIPHHNHQTRSKGPLLPESTTGGHVRSTSPESQKASEGLETRQPQDTNAVLVAQLRQALTKSIEQASQRPHIHEPAESSVNESDEEFPALDDSDQLQVFYRTWGYLPPLEEEAVILLDEIMDSPSVGRRMNRIGVEKLTMFVEGLKYRKVAIQKERRSTDPMVFEVENQEAVGYPEETDAEHRSHDDLWVLDRDRLRDGSNEALFQRTLMMSMVARHLLIYDRGSSTDDTNYLDISVEEPWNCPPMPTQAYQKLKPFLSQPKPDLAVSFRKHCIFTPECDFLGSTQRLAGYEDPSGTGGNKVFHFFTIEGKKAETSMESKPALLQSLNNASQALHNMYEFFNAAGEEHEKIFFDKVRFFSVVSAVSGLIIRIHRAVKVSVNARIEDDYPLAFEFREFKQIDTLKDRKVVLESFQNILHGYGVNKLRPWLQSAAQDLFKKLADDPVDKEIRENDPFYYQHRQRERGISRSKKASVSTIRFGGGAQSMTPRNATPKAANNPAKRKEVNISPKGKGTPAMKRQRGTKAPDNGAESALTAESSLPSISSDREISQSLMALSATNDAGPVGPRS